MSNEAAIVAVVAALYLFECVTRLPMDAEAFRANLRGRWISAGTLWQAEAREIRLVTAFPFLPGNRIVVCDDWPVRFSPDELWTVGHEAVRVPLDGPAKIEARSDRLLCGGRRIARLCSARHVRRVAACLRALQAVGRNDRARLIDREMRARLDAAAARRVHSKFLQAGRVLSVVTETLFLFLFLLGPLWMAMMGLNVVWPVLLTLVLPATWTCVFLFYRLHRDVAPEEGDARWGAAIGMVLSPAAAVRASATVERDLLSAFHPLAVAHCLGAEDLTDRAAGALRRVRFKTPDEAVEGAARTSVEWFDHHWSAALETFVRQNLNAGFAPFAPPMRESGSVCFCPRCHCQYVIARDLCVQCPGIAVQRFDAL